MAQNAVETTRVLVVSRETALLHQLWSIGDSNSWQLENVASGWEAMERVQSDVSPHILLLDLPRGDGDSMHILRWLRRLRPELPVFVLCYAEDASRQREAARLGAEAVLTRPLDQGQLERVLLRHLDSSNHNLEAEIASDHIEQVGDDECFLSFTPVMQKVRTQAELLAQADVPVMILGESGSGKSTVARLIHKLSVRSGFSFQSVNCATLPGHLLEMELFGRSSASSRGAEICRISPGKLEVAEKGTLLLEEITEMPADLQSKLLQVIQDKRFFRSGDARPIPADVRILATSSANLDQAMAEKRLRDDLYYRLSAFTVHVPPLRQRKEEIRALLQYSMHKLAQYYGLPPREFTSSVLQVCANHHWPGNLKELETFVKRYLMAGDEEMMSGSKERVAESGRNGVRPLFRKGEANLSGENAQPVPETKSLKSLIQNVKTETEKNAIASALDKTRWNRKAAARLLKVSYRTLLYKIDQYHMTVPEAYMPPFTRSDFKGNGRVG
jgi:DNA-binding NtrC family response regulator